MNSIMQVATISAAKMVYTSGPWLMNSSGPGWMPWIRKPPSMIAVTVSPGMPSVISGIMAPPTPALLAVSLATTPPILPLP